MLYEKCGAAGSSLVTRASFCSRFCGLGQQQGGYGLLTKAGNAMARSMTIGQVESVDKSVSEANLEHHFLRQADKPGWARVFSE